MKIALAICFCLLCSSIGWMGGNLILGIVLGAGLPFLYFLWLICDDAGAPRCEAPPDPITADQVYVRSVPKEVIENFAHAAQKLKADE